MRSVSLSRVTKRRIFDIIQLGNVSDIPSRLFDYALAAVIGFNILVMFLETFERLQPLCPLFDAVEGVTVGLFTVEYVLRIWTAEFLYPTRPRWNAALRYMISFDGVVSLLTILPFFFLSGAVVFRLLRVVRIFHLFRINATYDSFNVITGVLISRKNQILSSLFIVLVLMLGSSLCMYSVEHEAQPESFVNAFSGMWWSVSALLTVGYGDIYPVTVLGRVLAVFISFLGVCAVAIPTGIISAGFVEQYTEAQSQSAQATLIRTVHVDMDSRWLGRSVGEVRVRYGASVLLIQRSGRCFEPEAASVIELNDVLSVFTPGRDRPGI
ncbi:MAG: ion transporter [Clostridia bacterium]|nr:ion transporter [Clostridia bacterium]